MKKRIKVDSALLSVAILFSAVIYRFPHWYPKSLFWNNCLLVLGMMFILKGIFLRMAARGHKKSHSGNGRGLVTSGLYAYMRNPMYLGTFLVGVGFLLVAWPWWFLPIFAVLFYWRFNKQMVKEEKHLASLFGKDFTNYCQRVPRLFPRPSSWLKFNFARCCPWKEVWSTKETRGLYGWPVAVVLAESIKRKVVFGTVDLATTLGLMAGAVAAFFLSVWILYKREEGPGAKSRA